MAKLELQLLWNVDSWNKIRAGICHSINRDMKANNKYMKD